MVANGCISSCISSGRIPKDISTEPANDASELAIDCRLRSLMAEMSEADKVTDIVSEEYRGGGVET